MRVDVNHGKICIDASLLAPLLDLAPQQITELMRDGAITSMSERGVDADAGTLRLTFRYRSRRARVTIDATGKVLRRSGVDFGDRPPSHGQAGAITGQGRPAERMAEKAVPGDATPVDVSLDQLAWTTVVAFRAHPHVSNVMTHISGARWQEVERALRVILDPHATCRDLSPLAENIVDLMCAERGTTGRILKPYFHGLLGQILPPPLAARLRIHVACLFDDMQTCRATARDAESAAGQPPTEPVQDGASAAPQTERVIDARELNPRIRHTVIMQLCEHLDRDSSLQLIADHRPEPLRLQLEAKHGARYVWTYLETGPDIWRVRLQRR